MSFKIKRFNELTNYELYAILKERSGIFVVEQNCFYLDPDGIDLESYHLYKEENGEITAYLRIIPKGLKGDKISIGRVLVKKEYRGKGLGRELMQEALRFIREELREDSVELHAQNHLREFYGSLGFKIAGEVYIEAGIPHVMMDM
ncbi:GNAT family N-acetyltransferase [Clostridium polynesiense]|uniref:GNAT family N-acetyltransferase n=1 Tax=Clostridium polynesiense TaxID=1325933 RepID=UPI00058C628A|nr:GNAT family N-acetyltransferase [Clostridium polynesiense]